MIKSWKTTLGGILAAIGLAYPHKWWSPGMAAIGAFLTGAAASDHDKK